MYSCELEPTVRRYWIPRGHTGIEWTVDHMREIATDSARSSEVREAAADIVGSSSGADAARRIREFLEAHVQFKFDPQGVELIRTPELLLHQIGCNGVAFGDCDDVAVLGAALGLAAGLRPTYVLIGFHDTDPFEHVYTTLATDTGPVELDTTRPAHLPPELEIRRTELREFFMYGPIAEAHDRAHYYGLSGFWDDLGSGLVNAAPQVIPGATPAIATPGEDRAWWETGLEQVTTAAGTWAAEQIYGDRAQSTDPWGPGYVPPPWAVGSGAPLERPAEPAPVQAGMGMDSGVVNALVIGGLALAGLKLANVI